MRRSKLVDPLFCVVWSVCFLVLQLLNLGSSSVRPRGDWGTMMHRDAWSHPGELTAAPSELGTFRTVGVEHRRHCSQLNTDGDGFWRRADEGKVLELGMQSGLSLSTMDWGGGALELWWAAEKTVCSRGPQQIDRRLWQAQACPCPITLACFPVSPVRRFTLSPLWPSLAPN